MLLNRGVHRIGGKVQVAGPCDCTVIELNLRKQRRVGECFEDTGFWRAYKARKIDSAGETIGEGDAQPESREGFDRSDAPRRPGGDLGIQGSGRIFAGC